MQPPAALTRHRRELEEHLKSLLSRSQPHALYGMLRYHLGWEAADGTPASHAGKALRPSLCLLACEAAGGDPSRAVPAAAALELVHNFSLVHDDIQDRDELRHGRPTVWAEWGEAQAINAGDALLALAHISLSGCVDRGVAAEAVLRASRILNERTLEMVEGQVMDLDFERRAEVSLPEYLEMIERKTGALFDAALAIGALIGGASDEQVAAMGRCGRRLGIAFQVRDDMLGVWGAENRTGKPVASDIRRRKKSLPVVYGLQHSDGWTREEMRNLYARDELNDEDVSAALRALDAAGAQAYCACQAEDHRAAALAALEGAGFRAESVAALREAADFLLERDF